MKSQTALEKTRQLLCGVFINPDNHPKLVDAIAQAFEQYEQKLEICKKALQAQAYLDSGFAPPLFNVMPTRQLIAEALEKIK